MRHELKCLLVIALVADVACGGDEFATVSGTGDGGTGDGAADAGGGRLDANETTDGSADAGDVGIIGDGSSVESGGDAARDAVTSDSACGVPNTVDNCGACGVHCERGTTSSAQSCDGVKCSYTCNSGQSDCNASAAPNTDGCECATPSCCGAACATKHSDGLGESFYDCVPVGTYNQTEAMGACVAHMGATNNCAMVACGATTTYTVVANNSTTCFAWAYGGDLANVGHVRASPVALCACPQGADPTWN